MPSLQRLDNLSKMNTPTSNTTNRLKSEEGIVNAVIPFLAASPTLALVQKDMMTCNDVVVGMENDTYKQVVNKHSDAIKNKLGGLEDLTMNDENNRAIWNTELRNALNELRSDSSRGRLLVPERRGKGPNAPVIGYKVVEQDKVVLKSKYNT